MSELLNSDSPRGYRSLFDHEEILNNAQVDLMTHGKKVFGSYPKFIKWLNDDTKGKAPVEMLDTLQGVVFIDDKLTEMESGDNA